LCEQHELLFHRKWHESPKRKEREPVTEEESDADKAKRIVSAQLKARAGANAEAVPQRVAGEGEEPAVGEASSDDSQTAAASDEAGTEAEGRKDGTADGYPF
jgi:hypothetical protein